MEKKYDGVTKIEIPQIGYTEITNALNELGFAIDRMQDTE